MKNGSENLNMGLKLTGWWVIEKRTFSISLTPFIISLSKLGWTFHSDEKIKLTNNYRSLDMSRLGNSQ